VGADCRIGIHRQERRERVLESLGVQVLVVLAIEHIVNEIGGVRLSLR
jgi:hypothetical protein